MRRYSESDNWQGEVPFWGQFKARLLETVSNFLGLLSDVQARADTDTAVATGQAFSIGTSASSYTYLLSPDEESRHRNWLLQQAKNDQSFSAQQVREQADFTQSLDSKNLAELMRLLREENDRTVKSNVKLAELKSSPTDFATSAAATPWEYYEKTMSTQDCDRIVNAMRIAQIPTNVPAVYTSSYSSVSDHEDPSQRLEATKRWLRDTFSKPTDAVLLTMRDGERVVVSLGVSDDEVQAARGLQNDQRRAEMRSSEIVSRIRKRITEESQKATSPSPEQASDQLAAPVVQRLSRPSSRHV